MYCYHTDKFATVHLQLYLGLMKQYCPFLLGIVSKIVTKKSLRIEGLQFHPVLSVADKYFVHQLTLRTMSFHCFRQYDSKSLNLTHNPGRR